MGTAFSPKSNAPNTTQEGRSMSKIGMAFLAIASASFITGCQHTTNPKPIETHNTSTSSLEETQERVTGILIKKSKGKMYLVNGRSALRTYDIDLGFSPRGDKKAKGDGKTPEGTYYIDRKNPQSQFYLSLGISYPNLDDKSEANSLGVDPGGDIFIHGQGRWGRGKTGINWTRGCVAITDTEMNEVFDLVQVGTPVTILP
jgi:murein L,D-transpeptidase YafK